MNRDGIPNAVHRPSHYTQGAVECIDAMVSAFGEEAVQNWAKLNAFKYLWRAERKGGHEDLQKAIFYLKWASGEDPRCDGAKHQSDHRREYSLPVEGAEHLYGVVHPGEE